MRVETRYNLIMFEIVVDRLQICVYETITLECSALAGGGGGGGGGNLSMLCVCGGGTEHAVCVYRIRSTKSAS